MLRKLTDLQAGEAFGRYELLLPVARGGMSMVWAARLCGSHGFQKLVAIKTLIASKGGHALLERMLLEEARLASQIQHPNVAQYLDLGERDGVLYVVMEWIDGESLGAIMRHAAPLGGIPLDVSVQVIEQTCKGLHGAHELRDATGAPLGLVHCDVSPHNLMISDTGAVRLIDFGIAKATSSEAARNTVAGKLAFMSPEQARNEPLDRRSDLFSLGIVLYLLTTGRHPFPRKTSADMLRAMVENASITPPSVIHPSYPRALERVVLRALSHHREARFESAAEMLYALTEAYPSRAPEPEVGAFVRSVAGAALAERRTAIANALKNADALAEARARQQREAEARAAQARARDAFAAQARAAKVRAAQAQAAEARAAALRTSQPPTHASVPSGPEVIRMMQKASTDAPLERDARISNPFIKPRRRGALLALSMLAIAAVATAGAFHTGALDRLAGSLESAPFHASQETSPGSGLAAAPNAVAHTPPELAPPLPTEEATTTTAGSDSPSPTTAQAGCPPGDPACAKRRPRISSKPAKSSVRDPLYQSGEELEAKFAPDPAPSVSSTSEPPSSLSPPSPAPIAPVEEKSSESSAPSAEPVQRYGI